MSFQNGNSPRSGDGALRHCSRDSDLKKIKQICDESIAEHNITVEFKHVKAHKDENRNRTKNKKGEVIPLTKEALMNIDCDA